MGRGVTPRQCGGVLARTGKEPLLLPTVFLGFTGGGQASGWKAAPPLQIPRRPSAVAQQEAVVRSRAQPQSAEPHVGGAS